MHQVFAGEKCVSKHYNATFDLKTSNLPIDKKWMFFEIKNQPSNTTKFGS